VKRFVFALLISACLSPVAVSAQTISSVSPKTGSAGSVLTITGTGLSTASEPQVYLGDYPDELIELGGIFVSPCPVIRHSATVITCSIPPNPAGTVVEVLVVTFDALGEVSGEAVGKGLDFTYLPPVIQTVTPANGNTAGQSITIAGTDFGLSANDDTITVGGVPCADPFGTSSSIVCQLPPGQGTVPIVVTANGERSSVFNYTYGAPVISSVSPTTGVTSGNFVLTISGRNFGTSATVTIGGQPCPVISDANTVITCTVPAGSPGNLPLVVAVSGQTTESRFSYRVP
jgi:large repetitive protein